MTVISESFGVVGQVPVSTAVIAAPIVRVFRCQPGKRPIGFNRADSGPASMNHLSSAASQAGGANRCLTSGLSSWVGKQRGVRGNANSSCLCSPPALVMVKLNGIAHDRRKTLANRGKLSLLKRLSSSHMHSPRANGDEHTAPAAWLFSNHPSRGEEKA